MVQILPGLPQSGQVGERGVRPVDIIIPVYRDLERFIACIESLMSSRQAHPHEIVVINDASPEKEVCDYFDALKDDTALRDFHFLTNSQNRGYVASINRGISLHPDRDIVLLNSDTMVAGDWLDRLHRCAYEDERVGTISPFSNNAAILSFPTPCAANRLPEDISFQALDDIFARVNQAESIEIPTTIGFCMYIKRRCLDDVGLFDAQRFGKGYGEEGDFCFRASKQGWRHRLCADTFVYHAGGAGFGVEKRERENAAIAKVERRHPGYSKAVYSFVKADPAFPLRLSVRTELVRCSAKVKILFVTHDIGGGVEKHLQELVEMFRKDILPLVLRPADNGRVVLQLNAERRSRDYVFDLPADGKALVSLCRYLGVVRIHYHHLVGFDPLVWDLPNVIGVGADVTLHDFFLLNRQPLLDADCGLKQCKTVEDRASRCNAWHEKVAGFLRSVERVIAPSEFVAETFRAHFPDLEITVAYHPDWEKDAPYPDPAPVRIDEGENFRVAVLGAVSREKGADVLDRCARIAKGKQLPIRFHLVGYAYRPLHRSIQTTGPYEEQEIDNLIVSVNPHLIWFPGNCHETYSYTLSAALRSGRPLLLNNRGAMPERVAGRSLAWIVPSRLSCSTLVSKIQAIKSELFNHLEPHRWLQDDTGSAEKFYLNDYLTALNYELLGKDRADGQLLMEFAALPTLTEGRENTYREKVLRFLLRMRMNPLVAFISSFIPYRIQQKVKRKFSERPVHEIL